VSGLTIGAPVYISAADTVAHADANAEGTSNVIGLVLTVGASGTVVTHGVATAVFQGGDTWTAGDPVYLSLTSGRFTFDTSSHTTGDTIIELGYLKDGTGLTATTVDGETAEIHFNVGSRTGPL